METFEVASSNEEERGQVEGGKTLTTMEAETEMAGVPVGEAQAGSPEEWLSILQTP